MNTGNERFKRLFRFSSMIMVYIYEAAIFWVVWLSYNRILDSTEVLGFAMRGNWLMLAIYVMLLLLFSQIYGGFKIGYQKPGSLILSQAISLIGTNVVIYLVMALIARAFMNPLRLVIATSVQLVGVTATAVLLTKLYDTLFPPRKMLLIHGDYEESASVLTAKMNHMKEKYQINERVNQSVGLEVLQDKIKQSQGVVLLDVDVAMRNQLIKYCYGTAIRVYVVPNLSDIILGSAENIHFFDTPLLLARNSGLTIEQKLAKRIMDLVISGIGIIITSPFMLLTAIAIKLYDGGPVFFRQDRATIGGKVFSITKFRSMIVDAEKAGHSIPATDRDPRITPVGHFIRATRLDELPQLFDIFRGDMSIVGPRPERVEHVEKYTKEIPEFAYRLKVKGGLTGYAQIYGKYNTSAIDKLKLDLMYIENYSVLLDIKLILMTIKIMFMKESTEGFTAEKSEAMHDAGQEKKQNEQ